MDKNPRLPQLKTLTFWSLRHYPSHKIGFYRKLPGKVHPVFVRNLFLGVGDAVRRGRGVAKPARVILRLKKPVL